MTSVGDLKDTISRIYQKGEHHGQQIAELNDVAQSIGGSEQPSLASALGLIMAGVAQLRLYASTRVPEVQQQIAHTRSEVAHSADALQVAAQASENNALTRAAADAYKPAPEALDAAHAYLGGCATAAEALADAITGRVEDCMSDHQTAVRDTVGALETAGGIISTGNGHMQTFLQAA